MEIDKQLSNSPKTSKAILLLHSLGDKPDVFQGFADDIERAGYDVYSPVFSGHENGKINEVFACDMQTWLADGDSYINDLKEQDYEQIIVAGLSLGGLVALNLLAKHPDLIAGGIFSAPILGDIHQTKIEFFMRQRYFQALNRMPSPEDRQEAKQAFKELGNLLASIGKWMDEILPQLLILESPVHIGFAAADEVVDISYPKRLARSLRKSAKVNLQIYEQSNHYLFASPHADKITQDFLEFLHNLPVD